MMDMLQALQTLTPLAGIAMILLGSAWVKRFLRTRF